MEGPSELTLILHEALKPERPTVIDCPVDYGENLRMTENLKRVLRPFSLSLSGSCANVFTPFTKEGHMFVYLLVFAIIIGFPFPGFAQFVDKGEYVEVTQGTKLCPNVILEKSKGRLDPENVYWQVTSKVRANGTQTIAAFVLEALYDRKSGETTIKEHRYDEDYATLFKRSPEHKGMLLMISPKDGRVEATVEICRKKK